MIYIIKRQSLYFGPRFYCDLDLIELSVLVEFKLSMSYSALYSCSLLDNSKVTAT